MRRTFRFLILTAPAWTAAALSGLVVAGCGGGATVQPGPRVTLTSLSPQDESRTSAARIQISGRVSPRRAQVEVLGRRVAVSSAGAFTTTVGLSLGTNLIDVIASVPRSEGALSAIRVIRFALVTVPDVVGEPPARATATLRDLGLHVQRIGSDDPLNSLLPGSNTVCSSTPSAGARIDPDSLVVIKSSKFCF